MASGAWIRYDHLRLPSVKTMNVGQVSLLIFDECHHARQNHPYNVIMTDHYAECKDKPHIFGMTASPIWKSSDAAESIRTLELNLHAKVMSVQDHASELSAHANRPKEVYLRIFLFDLRLTMPCR